MCRADSALSQATPSTYAGFPQRNFRTARAGVRVGKVRAERETRGSAGGDSSTPRETSLDISSAERDPPGALLRALRRTGDEAQLTRVLASICAADPQFARAFAGLLLEHIGRTNGSPAIRRLRRALPTTIDCQAEAQLWAGRESRGRVDLRFTGPGFTLLVENKLRSGYGRSQLSRYSEALAMLPSPNAEGTATGLLAITRDVPSYGEASVAEDPRWLGSLRWAALLPALCGATAFGSRVGVSVADASVGPR